MSKEIQLFDDSIALINEINHLSIVSDLIGFDEIDRLTNSFMSIHQTEKSKLPYHINILDLLWANENAHSRIFAELLKQKNNNEFEILNSFLCYLTTQNPDFNQISINPQITSEKERIDILILDPKFAFIIENKIHDAIDQRSQIARYIDKTKELGYKENLIYVIYLTRDGTKKPENQSWINEKGIDYREPFRERFFSISFKQDILPWLTDYVLPNCKVKDVYLKSTIEQYIDYIKGMFNLREINHKMNSELQNHIKEVLELNSTPEINHSKLTNKLSQLIKVEEQIKSLLQSTEKECWNNWLRQLKIDFPNLDTVNYINANKFPKVGVIIKYNDSKFAILIEKDANIYYGIGRHEASTELDEKVKLFLKPLLEDFKESPWWYGSKNTSFKNGYSRLKTLIENVLLEIQKRTTA